MKTDQEISRDHIQDYWLSDKPVFGTGYAQGKSDAFEEVLEMLGNEHKYSESGIRMIELASIGAKIEKLKGEQMTPQPHIPFRELLHPATEDGFFYLEQPYPIQFEFDGRLWRFWIPVGFVYDVASIPRILWPIVSPLELGFKAPAAHDFLLMMEGKVAVEQWSTHYQKWRPNHATRAFGREEIDKMFCVLMRAEEIPRWKRRSAYRAVRFWGWIKKTITGREF
jgi:hypothetical protein